MSKTLARSKEEVATRNECNMEVARAVASRSKDPSTQVGAVIVDSNNIIKSTGYNGLPNGIPDGAIDWSRAGSFMNTKYPYVVHAEVNAIVNAKTDLTNCTIFVTLFPCHECAKLIVQAGIKKVVYEEDLYEGTESNQVAKFILMGAGVEMFKLDK